jgi:hypothetical protein
MKKFDKPPGPVVDGALLSLNGAREVVSGWLDEARRGKSCRWAHISLQTIKALVVGLMVSDLPRSGQASLPSVGAHMFFGKFPMAYGDQRSGPTNASAPCRLVIFAQTFTPFHSFPFAFSPFFFNIQDT